MMRHENINRCVPDMVQFMIIVLDLVIVNVAISTIQQQLGFGASGLPWIVITYGFLLGSFALGGWLGDVLGRRRAAAAGITVLLGSALLTEFTSVSAVLLAARALQGVAAALVATASLAVPPASSATGRARNAALRMFGAAGAASGAIGVLAQRLLPGAPAWCWTVFVHLPAAVLFVGLAFRLMPSAVVNRAELELEANSAIVVTGAIVLVVYGLHSGVELGWSSLSTLGLLASGAIMLTACGWVESRVRVAAEPLAILQEQAMVTTDVTACFALGGRGAHTWLAVAWCPCCQSSSSMHGGDTGDTCSTAQGVNVIA
jgi:MFS family permease